jgi:hypothetical protein
MSETRKIIPIWRFVGVLCLYGVPVNIGIAANAHTLRLQHASKRRRNWKRPPSPSEIQVRPIAIRVQESRDVRHIISRTVSRSVTIESPIYPPRSVLRCLPRRRTRWPLRTTEMIHCESNTKIYLCAGCENATVCGHHDISFVNWYRPEQWLPWARQP